MMTNEFFYTPLFFKRVMKSSVDWVEFWFLLQVVFFKRAMKLGESAQAIAKKRLDVQNRIRV